VDLHRFVFVEGGMPLCGNAWNDWFMSWRRKTTVDKRRRIRIRKINGKQREEVNQTGLEKKKQKNALGNIPEE